MPAPSPTWSTRQVFATYINRLTRSRESGDWVLEATGRIVNTVDAKNRYIFLPGKVDQGTLSTAANQPSLFLDLPIIDDPDNSPQGGELLLTIKFASGQREVYHLSPLESWPAGQWNDDPPAPGATDLATLLDPEIVPAAPPYIILGAKGGAARLDDDGDVVDFEGNKITGGGGGGVGVDHYNDIVSLPGYPTYIAAGASEANARDAIGAVASDDARLSNTRIPSDGSVSTAKLIDNAVTLAKLADMAVNRILGRATSGVGDPEELSAAQVRSILNVADGATANATDAQLRDRQTHSGQQTASTISDLAEAIDDRVAALLQGSTGVTLAYDDAANTLTITGSGSSGNPEDVRDIMGLAMIGAGLINITVNDAADTITISTTATQNQTDAYLLDLANATGALANARLDSHIPFFCAAGEFAERPAAATGRRAVVIGGTAAEPWLIANDLQIKVP